MFFNYKHISSWISRCSSRKPVQFYASRAGSDSALGARMNGTNRLIADCSSCGWRSVRTTLRPPTGSTPTRRSAPNAMWVLFLRMKITCFADLLHYRKKYQWHWKSLKSDSSIRLKSYSLLKWLWSPNVEHFRNRGVQNSLQLKFALVTQKLNMDICWKWIIIILFKATIEKDGGCNHMTCRNQACRAEFCWMCLGAWEPHGNSWYNCNRFDDSNAKNARSAQEQSRAALQRYLHFYNRYMGHQQSLRLEAKVTRHFKYENLCGSKTISEHRFKIAFSIKSEVTFEILPNVLMNLGVE